jgi:CRISPR-associated protein Cas2
MNYIVTYDVRDDRRRARISALLAKNGVRIQRSVFQCVLESGEMAEIVSYCGGILDLDVDVLQVFTMCESCREHQVSLGQANLALDEYFWVV